VRFVTAASSVMEMDDVLLAKMVSGGHIASSFFHSVFLVGASSIVFLAACAAESRRWRSRSF